ncbi:MAG: hypothetical protein ACR2N5_08065 [Solirubrobacterales bacterium]
MSFGFLIAGFFAVTNAGRVALAREEQKPSSGTIAAALIAGALLAVIATIFATDLLDALTISPESFRIAAGVVLLVTAIRTLFSPRASTGPFAAVLFPPELAAISLSFGADEPTGKVLGAAAITLPFLVVASVTSIRIPPQLLAQILAGLQIVIAIALAISGMRDV